MKLFILFFLGIVLTIKAQYTVSYPIDRSVYQRNGSGSATIPIAGHFPVAACSGYTAEYKIDLLNSQTGSVSSTHLGWTTFYPSSLGVFHFTATLSTGWYMIYVRLKENSSGNTVHSYGLKVGVGDVFILSGQSNMAGEHIYPAGNTYFKPSGATAPDDCISSIPSRNDCNSKFFPLPSGFAILSNTTELSSNGKNGWFYTELGNKLRAANGTPVSFFNTAYDGTSVLNWAESAAGSGTLFYGSQHCGSVGEPYRTLKRGLNLFASTFGVRAILWQQGEADNVDNTSRTDYKSRLKYVIDQTRSDFGSDIYWLIAKTSYYPGSSTDANITDGQADVISDVTTSFNNKAGPDTDSFGSNYRNTVDGVHFSYNNSASVDGFEPLAEAWKSAINTANPSRISANAAPVITMTKSGSNYTLSVPTGYDEYRWVYSGDRLDDYFDNNRVLNLTSSSTTGHRCYVRTGNNWIASGVVYPKVEGCYSGSRQGLEEKFEEDLGLNFKVSPNPSDNEINIEFSLTKNTQVRVDIVDIEGKVVKHILENELPANRHKYSEKIYNLPEGIYMCRLMLNGLILTKKILKN